MTEVIEQTEYKKGYKKTKLGWIPEDWEVILAGDISSVVTGGTPSKVKPEYWNNGNINWMNSSEVNKKYIYEVENKITKIGLDNSNTKILPINTIMIALNGQGKTRGTVAILKIESCCNQSLAGFICKEGTNYQFLFFFLQNMYDDLRNITGDGSRTGLNLNILRKLKIILPPLKEQGKIAEILSAWDDGIEAFEKLIEQKEIFHKALMKNLLIGKIRLSGYNSKWTHSKFNSIFERITRKNEELNSNILTISAQNGLISQKDFYNKRIASVDTSKYILLKNGEFAYNKSYSNGYPLGAIKRLDLYEKGVVSSLYICFKLNNSDNCSEFWKYYFETGMLNREIKMIAQEGARNHGLLNMATEDFFNMLLYHPKDSKEQQKIAEILNKSDKEIQLLNSKLEKLKEQKKGLMQKLLTGQIRVKM